MTDLLLGGLAWGQTEIVDWLAINDYNLPGIISVVDLTPPGGVSDPDRVDTALRALVMRHEALRTKVVIPQMKPGYKLAPAERPEQFVDDDAGFRLERWTDGGGYTAAEFLSKIGDGYATGASSLDPREDPSRGMIYRRPDGRFGCLLITSRLLSDGAGGKRLAEEFLSLSTDCDASRLPLSVGPLGVAASETGASKQALSLRNIAWSRQLLEETPGHLLVRQVGSGGSATTTRSASFAAHVDTLSRRFGIPNGGIVTSLLGLLQWREHGCDTVLVRALTQLPPPVRDASYVGPNAMPALSAIPVNPGWTFNEFFTRAWASIVSSYRRCSYDPTAFDRMQHELATRFGRELLDGLVYLNYHSQPSIFDQFDESEGEAELGHTTVERHDRVFRTLFDVKKVGESMTLHVEGSQWKSMGDTRGQTETLLAVAAVIAVAADDQITVGNSIGVSR